MGQSAGSEPYQTKPYEPMDNYHRMHVRDKSKYLVDNENRRKKFLPSAACTTNKHFPSSYNFFHLLPFALLIGR